MNQSKKLIDKIVSTVNNTNATNQVLIGSVSGWVTGYATMKVGKTMAFAAGSGIIVYQIAHSRGLVNLTWEELRDKAEKAKKDSQLETKAPTLITKVKEFSNTNTPFTAGFIGGFLIGIAT